MKDLIVFLLGVLLALFSLFVFSVGLKMWGFDHLVPSF